ncbi:hypothetical protein [Nostoc commune]|nr:hypothetical protein [Nostoc commune]
MQLKCRLAYTGKNDFEPMTTSAIRGLGEICSRHKAIALQQVQLRYN